MRQWGMAFCGVVLALLTTPVGETAEQACDRRGHCLYEGAPIHFRVTDAKTGKPLADVHALAEWVLEGYHGANGPLMVQDAVSSPDGKLGFPAWGPVPGPAAGLRIRLDPAISLFKPGYRVLLLTNSYIVESVEKTTTLRVRRFDPGEQNIAIERFHGKPEAWVEELDKAAWPGFKGRTSLDQLLPFRVPYSNRLRRVLAEQDRVPEGYRRPGQTFWHVERELRSFAGEKP